eukprot:g80.t1
MSGQRRKNTLIRNDAECGGAGINAKRPLSPMVRRAARRSSASFSGILPTTPATPRTIENERKGDQEVELLRKVMEESAKMRSKNKPKIKVNIPPGALRRSSLNSTSSNGLKISLDACEESSTASLRPRSSSSSGRLTPTVRNAALKAGRRRTLSKASEIPLAMTSSDDEASDGDNLPMWVKVSTVKTTDSIKRVRYSIAELRSLKKTERAMGRPVDMPEPPVELDRLVIQGPEQGLYMSTVVRNALLVLDLVMGASRTSKDGMRISTLGSKFKTANPIHFYRGITRDLVPVLVDAGLAKRVTIDGDLFLRLTPDALERKLLQKGAAFRPRVGHVIASDAKNRLENAFRMQRMTVEEMSDVASVASSRSDPFDDTISVPGGDDLVPRTIDNILGTRISGHVFKSGSVYGFIKADFEEPDLGEIFFLAREVQGKRRLDVGSHVTFEVSRKGQKFRALRIVPLSVPPALQATSGSSESGEQEKDSNENDMSKRKDKFVEATKKKESGVSSWRSRRSEKNAGSGRNPTRVKTGRVRRPATVDAKSDDARRGHDGGGFAHLTYPPSSHHSRGGVRGFGISPVAVGRRPRWPPSSRGMRSGASSTSKRVSPAGMGVEDAAHMQYSRGPDGSTGFGRGSRVRR